MAETALWVDGHKKQAAEEELQAEAGMQRDGNRGTGSREYHCPHGGGCGKGTLRKTTRRVESWPAQAIGGFTGCRKKDKVEKM